MLRSIFCICVAVIATSITVAAHAAAPKNAPPLATICGEDAGDLSGIPIDRVRQVINPTDAERRALDDLAEGSTKAAQTIAAACSSELATTAPARLAATQQRLEAMVAAVNVVRPAIDKLFGLLDDEQKAKVTALGEDQGAAGPLAQLCQAASAHAWPIERTEQAVHPDDAQHQKLAALKDASDQAAEVFKASCPSVEPLTAPARMAALQQRVGAMLQAVKTERVALDSFYATLSEDQKTAFNAIGAEQTATAEGPSASHTQELRHHRHRVSVRGLIRRFISIIR
jgi:hypothetical protein